jgi:acyl-CoA hydrolase
VSNHKGVFDGFSISTFAAGSAELYRWMDRNPEVRMLPVAEVNDPAIIRRNRRMVSINGAMAIDLTSQVMADTLGRRQYSGVGGHELFVIGAHDCPDGKSIICLHSTATVGGRPVSTIVAELPSGTPVTTPRHHVQYVVTEHGIANLGLLPARARAEALIAIADPAFRDELSRRGNGLFLTLPPPPHAYLDAPPVRAHDGSVVPSGHRTPANSTEVESCRRRLPATPPAPPTSPGRRAS